MGRWSPYVTRRQRARVPPASGAFALLGYRAPFRGSAIFLVVKVRAVTRSGRSERMQWLAAERSGREDANDVAA